GSLIECQNQILGEGVSVVGTPFSLHYQSDRTPGRKLNDTLDIPLSGITVPVSLKRIDLEVLIAGRRFTQEFPAAPNQRTTFAWDGKDAYSRTLQGEQVATIRIGYVYAAIYQTPAQFEKSFALLSGVPIRGNFAC